MSLSRRIWAILLSSGLLLSASGCGGPGKTIAEITGRTKLEEVANMLQLIKLEGKKPPARPADLDSLEPSLPTAFQDLRSGDIVYVWGAGLSDVDAGPASKVIAYEKKVPTEGGWVLTQDSAIKEMTAAEFNAAPKAK